MVQQGAYSGGVFQKLGVSPTPFNSRLSLLPLIRHLEQKAEKGDSGESFLARQILDRVNIIPEFREPIDNTEVIKQNREVLELIMLTILPPALRETQLTKISVPFETQHPVYVTPALEKMLSEGAEVILENPDDLIYQATVIRACSLILNTFYGQDIQVDPLISFAIQKSGSELVRYFKVQFNIQYVDVKALKPLLALSQEQIHHLLSNIYDIDLWLKHIPADHFEFQGFVIGTLVDITKEEVLSRLKYRLLEKDAVVDAENIKDLQRLLRLYFQIPGLRLGLTAIDFPVENAVAHKYRIRFDFLANRQPVLLTKENTNSVYEKVCQYGEVLLVEDLQQWTKRTPVEDDLIREGIRSLLVAPLFNKNRKVIGLLEIGSPNPYELNSFRELKFREIIGLFSMAVERSREEIDNRIEAIIREQYTAVHPSVEWRFVEASYNLMEKRENGEESALIEPILFQDVYPLYGQADIVRSSNLRNRAIQDDLLENLQLVADIIEKGIALIQYPLLNQFQMKVAQSIRSLSREFSSNDETSIVELLVKEIHPLLRNLEKNYPALAMPIAGYFSLLDADLNIVYNKRKAFEESVAIVNNTIGAFLDHQQKEWQKALPHYFEKYKTDGVEYEIYVGQSLLRNTEFCKMHLKNFRLWQLIDMCKITNKVGSLYGSLPVPLTTAQLVFAYTTPLSIRFRMDEKQFDVDGAYNVRYEILKKRIDKAVIDGTDERLTAAGKIAIVYLQERDRQEYLDYIDYLIHEGYIEEEVEELKLGRLQGVQGLRALRITVKPGL